MKYIFALVFALSFKVANGQNYNAYTDFHIHVGFKNYNRNILSGHDILKHRNNQSEINKLYGNVNWQPFGYDSQAKKEGATSTIANYNQSDFTELKDAGGSILVNSIYPYEKTFTTNFIFKKVARSISGIGKKRLDNIASDGNSPFEEFLGEYYYIVNQNLTKDRSTFSFPVNSEQIKKNIDANVTSVLFSIEGGHALQGRYTTRKKYVRKLDCDGRCEEEILNSIKELKNLEHRIFFVTPAHFSWNKIVGNAKTLDREEKRAGLQKGSRFVKFRKIAFLKFGEGIHGMVGSGGFKRKVITTYDGTRWRIETNVPRKNKTELTIGKKVFEELLKVDNSAKNPQPILVDVKHMDIKARTEYYKMREDILAKDPGRKIPIIASHVAVSGENLDIAQATGLNPLYDRYEELINPLKFYTDQKALDSTWKNWNFYHHKRAFNPFDAIDTAKVGWFYPWSINLADEEIAFIHDSGGIIGIMLDGRQLGAGMPKYKEEAYAARTKAGFDRYSSEIVNSSVKMDFDEYKEIEPFLRNIAYIVEHCNKTGKPCWDHVSIGSDFDGLIDPMKICPAASYIPGFRKKTENYLNIYLKMYNKVGILNGLSVKQAVDKVFFSNGQAFVLSNY